MANACIAFSNLADAGALLASSQELLAPVSNLQHPDVVRRWRGTEVGLGSFVCDLGGALQIDTVALMGMTMSAAGTGRVRISAMDSTGETGELFDTGVVPVSNVYNQLIALSLAPVAGRFVRVDLADAGAAYVEAGRLFIGLRRTFLRNFDYGWQRGFVDLSLVKRTRGGQQQVWRDVVYRTLDLNFSWLEETEKNDFVEDVDRVNGLKDDVLFVIDPESTNLARDSIWGLMATITPVANPQMEVFSKQYRIEERL